MKQHRRAIALLATAALGVTALTSCTAAPSDDEDVTITWWATNLASSIQRDEEILTPILERFTEETGIKVEFEVNTWADYYNKVLGAVSSGEGPDVMSVGTTWTQTLADTGAFLQLDGTRMDAIGGADKFVPASIAAAGGDAEGGPSFLPMVNGVTNLWYNPAMFAEAGLTEPPADLDSFVEVAKQLTIDTDGDGSIDQWGLGYPAGSAQELSHTIFAFGRQYGGEMFDKDGEPTLDADGIVEAAKSLTDLMAAEGIVSTADVESTQSQDMYQEFIDGRVAMIWGANPVPAFRDAGFEDYAPGYIPVIEPLIGDPIQTHIAGVNIGVFAETKHEEAALELMRYLTDVETQADFWNELELLPTNAEAYDSGAVEKTEAFEIYSDILANHADTFPLNSKTGQAETLIGDAMKQLFARAALEGPLSEAAIREVLEQANTQLIAAG
ncbi:ABC transporter substrate-binding protein [Agromyces albus]|uniref:Sugar ABC transporter substrate-binding protein n=1 Tax=Agromyces albus TaxID=205332 RepID=A0A4Q2L4M6_9MICO|nr:sugar ABC transporter substrate-binding protein [Agromyces albus]RXZ71820.1 sugar ABC transporter substrate-binding protein [Agromyces albus]